MSKDLYGLPRTGGDVLAACSKCRMELAHVIVSMLNGRPAKVMCKTCKGTHNYKMPVGSSSGRPVAPRAARKTPEKKTARVAEIWEEKMAAKKSAAMRPYTVKDSFTVGDVIQHPTFGVGMVEEVRGNGKITVLFREDQKVLIHELGKSA